MLYGAESEVWAIESAVWVEDPILQSCRRSTQGTLTHIAPYFSWKISRELRRFAQFNEVTFVAVNDYYRTSPALVLEETDCNQATIDRNHDNND
jgi:hypothetical protein